MIQLQMQAKQNLELVGVSKTVNHMREFAYKASTSDDTVLLMGETGTGKDHLAGLIHHMSRKDKLFVAVDCGIITESLLEAELFGHTQGAFTDARLAKAGLVQVAEEGTLFFNEIANMSPTLQAKFLRVLDKQSFRAVGGTKEIPVNTRIIAATNSDLESAVQEGKFRQDLFHRLNVITFILEPLRNHIEDVPVLAKHFLEQNDSSRNFSADAFKALQSYNWPGNVRELRNMIKKISFFSSSRSDITAKDVYEVGFKNEANNKVVLQIGDEDKFLTLKELRRVYFQEALKRTNGNISKAALITGISRSLFARIIRQETDFRGLISLLKDSKK